MSSFIKRCFNAIIIRSVWFFFRLFPVKQKKITISSFYGRGYGDNPKYIVEELIKKCPQLKIVWLVKDDKEKSTLPIGVQACRANSIKSVYHLMTSKVWVDNCRKFFIMFKRRKQFYIQTWHGFALKRIEKDAADKLSPDYVKSSKRDSKNIDCIISCSKFMTGLYRNSFWYDGEILEVGAPRNDVLLKDNADIREKVCALLDVDPNKRIVLYAPTFRANKAMDAYCIDYARLKNSCEKRFNEEFEIVVRLHPNIANKSKDMALDQQIVDASFYPDMQELMLASDIIISDYSSVMFDFALTYRPCFQFATDIDEYKNDRNFYFEPNKLPFSVSVNNEELEYNIVNFDEAVYREGLQKFFENVGMIMDGKASEKCADLIIEKCYGKQVK